MKLRIAITAALALFTIIPSTVLGEYWHGDFVDNRTTVFSVDAVMYDAPDLDSSVMVLIPMGTNVEISGSAGEYLFADGMPSYWYNVTCTQNGSEYNGYMPGLYLAMSSLELGTDTLFMFNVTGYIQKEYRFTASARIVISGDIAAEKIFHPVGSSFGQVPYRYCIRASELNTEGLDRIKNLIELSFIYGACGYVNRDILFAWTGDEFIMGPEANSQFEADIYRFIETFVTPSDSSGVPDEVTVLTSLAEWDEEIDDYIETESSYKVYCWNGNEFTLPDEQ
ncbi:MAG: hypothetical protein K8S24_12145 [Candidatus Aegiribacteria sp.]|nr:hypothetical protein [Candidatus Aegiribacteria sp.]